MFYSRVAATVYTNSKHNVAAETRQPVPVYAHVFLSDSLPVSLASSSPSMLLLLLLLLH
jgi:hypothetical protein